MDKKRNSVNKIATVILVVAIFISLGISAFAKTSEEVSGNDSYLTDAILSGDYRQEKEAFFQEIDKIKDSLPELDEVVDKVKEAHSKVAKEVIADTGEAVKKSFAESISDFFEEMKITVKEFIAGIFS